MIVFYYYYCKPVTQAYVYIFHNLICAHQCANRVFQTLGLSRQNDGSLCNIDIIFTDVRCRHLTSRQQESRRGYRWQQSWRTSNRKMSLLCLLPVDGVIELLHLLVSEDTISEVRLELLQRQLPVVWKEKNSWKWHLADAWKVLSP